MNLGNAARERIAESKLAAESALRISVSEIGESVQTQSYFRCFAEYACAVYDANVTEYWALSPEEEEFNSLCQFVADGIVAEILPSPLLKEHQAQYDGLMARLEECDGISTIEDDLGKTHLMIEQPIPKGESESIESFWGLNVKYEPLPEWDRMQDSHGLWEDVLRSISPFAAFNSRVVSEQARIKGIIFSAIEARQTYWLSRSTAKFGVGRVKSLSRKAWLTRKLEPTGLTIYAFSEKVKDVDAATVRRWANSSKRSRPSTRLAIAKAIDCDLDELPD
jgi:hypothetical protein